MSTKMTLEKARETFTIIRVHAPTLGDGMQPDFSLINMACPFNRDGHCGKCPNFQGVDLSETDGAIFAHASFDGFCSGGKDE